MPSSAPPRRRGLALATAVLLATSACTVANSEAGDAGAGGNTLRIVLAQEPPTLEPCESSLTGTGMVVRSTITEPLIERDPTTGDLEPLLSTGWRQTSPTTWTFDIRSGVTFQDGQPFTAADAAFAIDRAVNSDLMCNVDGYVFGDDPLGLEVDNPAQLTVTTEKPDPILPLRLSMVFQDPYASLNERMTAAELIGEPWRTHRDAAPADRVTRVRDLLELVGLRAGDADRYPGEFSGGQRQRIGIARALALNPDLIVCDEPVSALDLSVQAQVLNLLAELQRELGVSYLFISHDLSVVRHVADRVSVMYLGKVVEEGPTAEVFDNPVHPYTAALMSAAPSLAPGQVDTRVVPVGLALWGYFVLRRGFPDFAARACARVVSASTFGPSSGSTSPSVRSRASSA